MTKQLTFTFRLLNKDGLRIFDEVHNVTVGAWGALDREAIAQAVVERLAVSLLPGSIEVFFKGEALCRIDRAGRLLDNQDW